MFENKAWGEYNAGIRTADIRSDTTGNNARIVALQKLATAGQITPMQQAELDQLLTGNPVITTNPIAIAPRR
jgi:hypothetical protein